MFVSQWRGEGSVKLLLQREREEKSNRGSQTDTPAYAVWSLRWWHRYLLRQQPSRHPPRLPVWPQQYSCRWKKKDWGVLLKAIIWIKWLMGGKEARKTERGCEDTVRFHQSQTVHKKDWRGLRNVCAWYLCASSMGTLCWSLITPQHNCHSHAFTHNPSSLHAPRVCIDVSICVPVSLSARLGVDPPPSPIPLWHLRPRVKKHKLLEPADSDKTVSHSREDARGHYCCTATEQPAGVPAGVFVGWHWTKAEKRNWCKLLPLTREPAMEHVDTHLHVLLSVFRHKQEASLQIPLLHI